MAFSSTVDIRDQATPMLEATRAKIAPATVNKVVARSGQNFVRKHFTHLNSTRANAMGGKRTNFYTQAARGTSSSVDANGANVSVNQVGIRQRIFGGTILPKKGKWLTIPARAEAYGRRASEFQDLKFGYAEDERGRERPALVRDSKSKEFWGEEDAMFWLVPKVVQKADPTVMPNLGQMREAILVDLGVMIRAREQKMGGQA
jgi:hypothetical protein